MTDYKILKVAIFIALFFSFTGVGLRAQSKQSVSGNKKVTPSQTEAVFDTSLIALIANPEKHHGKIVRVIGYVRLEFEGTEIYVHHDFDKFGISDNALWLEITDDIRKNATKYDRKYVILQGRFNAERKGHMALNSGAIEAITRFDVWSEMSGRSDGDQ